ncbi:hypothetical protein SDC9_113557 [bioreactor metagenome]|uniref:DUF4332 domain-containing protein n=1 Tax=bioreactor metagenome TaxID=1076179 RepID=A0A645BN36_9ZZZZ
MKYNLDLDSLSVQAYKELLKAQNLLPGRKILLHDIDQNFVLFENRGINTIAQLRKSLSTPQKIASFSADSGISEDYLVILKRETGSLEQKPVPIANFPGINPSLISALNGAGIKTSKDYFEKNQSASDELYCLCDLVRINGIGPVAAKALLEAGYKSVSDVACADAAVMHAKISKVNEIKQYYKAKLGLKDMQFCIDFASLLLTLCA